MTEPRAGNVRELQNVVERACALAEADTVTVRDLPDHVLAAPRSPTTSASEVGEVPARGTADLRLKEARARWMAVIEASYLRTLLGRRRGNVSAAAAAAGIDRKTFHRQESGPSRCPAPLTH